MPEQDARRDPSGPAARAGADGTAPRTDPRTAAERAAETEAERRRRRARFLRELAEAPALRDRGQPRRARAARRRHALRRSPCRWWPDPCRPRRYWRGGGGGPGGPAGTAPVRRSAPRAGTTRPRTIRT